MMRLNIRIHILALFIFSSFQFSLAYNPIVLSDNSEISLITCVPGIEVYSVFGHSAIRVKDDVNRIDWVYNYGTFDFSTPNFIMKFARAKLPYYLSLSSMNGFHRQYEYEERSYMQQVLNLGKTDRQKIFDFLVENEKPENREYKYDFFFDNCATRERDVMKDVLGSNLRFNGGKGDYGTFRSMIDPYLEKYPWTDFGIDLTLGVRADAEVSIEDAMFLPDFVASGFKNAEVNVNGKWEPLVKSEAWLYKTPLPVDDSGFPLGPVACAWIFLGLTLGLTFLSLRNGRIYRLFDFLLFFIFGIVGLLLFFLWFMTDHQACVWNLNLLWAWPTHFFFAFFLLTRMEKLKSMYAKAAVVVLLVFFFTNWFLPQDFHHAFYPYIVAMLVRVALYSGWVNVRSTQPAQNPA